MNNKHLIRLVPEIDFPEYAFLPGRDIHPNKPGGHAFNQSEQSAEMVDHEHPEKSRELRYGLDLLNFGYFWESHVQFEALWNAHGRNSDEALFFKALIKIGAAGLKENLGQKTASAGHLERSLQILKELNPSKKIILGFDIETLAAHLMIAKERGINFLLPIYPLWA